MKRLLILTSFIAIFALQLGAQVLVTKNGYIRFFSTTPVENIEAKNNQVNCALDSKNNKLIFKVLIKSFVFEKALMQEHFNENYMESDKFPSASFTGKITNINELNLSKNGIYKVSVEGEMSIHGVAKNVKESGTAEVKDGKVRLKAKFNVKPKDYQIKIPAAVATKIAESIEVSVDCSLSPMDKK
jgi:hypothetical protein